RRRRGHGLAHGDGYLELGSADHVDLLLKGSVAGGGRFDRVRPWRVVALRARDGLTVDANGDPRDRRVDVEDELARGRRFLLGFDLPDALLRERHAVRVFLTGVAGEEALVRGHRLVLLAHLVVAVADVVLG